MSFIISLFFMISQRHLMQSVKSSIGNSLLTESKIALFLEKSKELPNSSLHSSTIVV